MFHDLKIFSKQLRVQLQDFGYVAGYFLNEGIVSCQEGVECRQGSDSCEKHQLGCRRHRQVHEDNLQGADDVRLG